jgi:hypothetical protein
MKRSVFWQTILRFWSNTLNKGNGNITLSSSKLVIQGSSLKLLFNGTTITEVTGKLLLGKSM